MNDYLDVTCRVSKPGGWLDINDHRHYELGGETFKQRQIRYRRQEVSSPYTDGSFTVNTTKSNVREAVQVKVTGISHRAMRVAVDELVDVFAQNNYTMQWEIGGDAFTWLCQPADATIDTRREFLHAKLATVSFEISRHPEVAA